MKFILPVHHFPPRHTAGAELYTLRLARWLQHEGHEVEVVTIDSIDQGAPGELRVSSDSYQGVPVQRLTFNLIDAPERQRWNYDNALIGDWFAGYLQRSQPDLVHFQAGYLLGIAPLRAAVEAGIPSALTLHDYWFLCPRHTLQQSNGALCLEPPANPSACAWCRCSEQRPFQLADQLTGGAAGKLAQSVILGKQTSVIADRRARVLPMLAAPQVVIAPSRFLAERFAPYVPAERLVVSRYGIDLARFQAQPRTAPSDRLRIGFTGQIAHHKGVHLLVEAFTRLDTRGRQVELAIHGGLDAYPGYVQTLRQLAGNDPRITFHGRFESQQAAAILAGLSVTVVPSTWFENSPLAIMEAHAAGTPVITSGAGGMAELVRDGVDGLHFAINDSAALARTLQRLIDDPGLLDQLQAGVQPPRSIEDEMRQVSTIYDTILANHLKTVDS